MATDATGFHAQRVLWMCSCERPRCCVFESNHWNQSIRTGVLKLERQNWSARTGVPESECQNRSARIGVLKTSVGNGRGPASLQGDGCRATCEYRLCPCRSDGWSRYTDARCRHTDARCRYHINARAPVICPACRVGNPPTNGDGVFADVHR